MRTVFSTLTLLLLVTPLMAEIYRSVDEHGNVTFSDRPGESGASQPVQIEDINSFRSPEIRRFERARTPARSGGEQVVMYSASWCGVCDRARNHFEENGIPYSEYDIEESEQALREFREIGGKGVPVLLYGDRRMDGFSESDFDRTYENL